MKNKIFGLKKEPVDQMLRKMESDFLSEKVEIENELNSMKEENEKIRVQIKEKKRTNLGIYEDDPLWNLDESRLNGITNYLREQKEQEMANLREEFSERKNSIQLQIKEIDVEIQSTAQQFTEMFHRISNLVEQAEEVSVIEELEIKEIKAEQTKVVETTKQQTVDHQTTKHQTAKQPTVKHQTTKPKTGYPLEEKPIKLEEVASEMDGEDSLLHQIDAIKSRYIVGKVAGEDLIGLQGNLIISKSSIITRQAVNQAHREGKLASLIVNMKIPGLGED